MAFEEKSALDELIKEVEQEIEVLAQKLYSDAEPSYQALSISKDLVSGKKVSNVRFDRVYPSMIRKLSSVHWSPVDVVIKASALLANKKNMKILDVGSGCGKFCIIGAVTHPDVHFYGIEQRSYLNEISKGAARSFKLNNVTFINGNMTSLDWSEYDAFYLFNPFYENKMLPFSRIDISVPVSQYRYDFYLETVHAKLSELKVGTRVVTYHGFGGNLPDTYELSSSEPTGSSELELWVKVK
ncbi:methyltransferase domain-containing protein [Peredibacter sp. HCB2-198]|uniref:methyltransferase domain-containing protein n=1 Tax=Peredibacter sp. HCB2-198 TaxID=3383025 RepID=UPI0038B54052